MSESQPPPDQRTHSEYWFKDGNVVLQAEHTLFRVHQSILSRHSQVFQDMFAIPHAPSQENEYIEGCPVIPLSDTAKDMDNIITLLYDPKLTLEYGRLLPVKLLGSMLRLGRKYGIASFEDAALESLHHDCPTTIYDWDVGSGQQKIDLDADGACPEDLISIANEFRLFTTLPAAYIKYLKYWNLYGAVDTADLSEESRKHCIHGYARIQTFVKEKCVDALCPPMVLPSKLCYGAKCEANKWKVIRGLSVWYLDSDNECPGIFDPWQPMKPEEKDLCSKCRSAVKSMTNKVREEFWLKLPTFFDLPDWADLKDAQFC